MELRSIQNDNYGNLRVFHQNSGQKRGALVSKFVLLFALSSKLPRFGSDDLAQIGLSSETEPWELRSKRLDFGQISGSFRLKKIKKLY